MWPAAREREEEAIDAVEDVVDLRGTAESRLTQVPEGRTADQGLREVQGQIAEIQGDDIQSLSAAIEEIRARIDALPLPDLGAVALQLARLNASIVSQNRRIAASTEHVEALERSVESSVQHVADQLDAHAEATTAAHERLTDHLDTRLLAATAEMRSLLGIQPSPPNSNAELHRVVADLQTALDGISAELAAMRKAKEGRTGSRWRRGGEDPPATAVPAGSTDFEQRVERALAEIHERIGAVGAVAERAAASAERRPLRAAAPREGTPAKAPAAKKAAAGERAPAKKASD
jgi:hypothetical protein